MREGFICCLKGYARQFNTSNMCSASICGIKGSLPQVPLLLLLNYSMEQRHCDASRVYSQSRNSLRFMETGSSLPYSHVPILSQLHPVSSPSLFPKILLNIILPSTSGSPQQPLSLGFPHLNHVHTYPLPHAPTTSFFSILPPANIGWGLKIPKHFIK